MTHVTEFDHASTDFDCPRTFRPAATSNMIVPGHSATAKSQPSMGLQQDSEIVLQGLVVDVVDQCTSRPIQADEVQWLRHDPASGVPEDDAFWRTLATDRSCLGVPALQSLKDEYPKVLDYL